MQKKMLKALFLGAMMVATTVLTGCKSEADDAAIEQAVERVVEKNRQAAIDKRNAELEQINAVRGAIQ